jgi:hypothetical protein
MAINNLGYIGLQLVREIRFYAWKYCRLENLHHQYIRFFNSYYFCVNIIDEYLAPICYHGIIMN